MKCPQCQRDNPAGTTTCFACGHALAPAAPEDEPAAGFASAPPAASAPEEEVAHVRELRRKRAFSSGIELTGSSPYITQPSAGRGRVSQVERQMSLLLGAVFLVVIALAGVAVYLNIPEKGEPYYGSPLAALIEQALNKRVRPVNAETWTGQEIGAAMLYDVNATETPKPPEALLAEAPPAAGPARTERKATKPTVEDTPPPPTKEEPQEAKVEPLPPPEAPLPVVEPVQVAAAAPVEITLPPRQEPSPVHKVAVVDRSINAEKPRKRSKAGCAVDEQQSECGHRYVVTFKRTWGPVLEERAYSSREMSRRAQQLWHREGKILEPDGAINDTYVVKPKTFTPIPGHPVS